MSQGEKVEIISPNPVGKAAIAAEAKTVSRWHTRDAVFGLLAVGLLIGGTVVHAHSSTIEHPPSAVAPEPDATDPRDLHDGVHELLAAPAIGLGDLEWDDKPAELFARVRFVQTLQRDHTHPLNGVVELAVVQPDGLWRFVRVSLFDPVPDTDLRVMRIEKGLAVVADPDDKLHRLFHPSGWTRLQELYGFKSGSPIPPEMTRLSQSVAWLLPSGSRAVGPVAITHRDHSSLGDDEFRQIVPVIDAYMSASTDDPAHWTADGFAEWLNEHMPPSIPGRATVRTPD